MSAPQEKEQVGARLMEAAAAWTDGPVRVDAGPSARRLGDAVWVLPVEGLARLAEAVTAATRGLGEPAPPGRPFRGHLTLARSRRPDALRGLPPVAVEAWWAVDEITLVASELRPSGARYSIVGRWWLGGE